MKICRFFYFVALALTLTAFAVGEYAELENLLNARAGYDFTKQAKNIKFQVPKGTVGKVLGYKKFNSGNYGVELDLQNGKNKGEKVFVYFTPGKPNISFSKENPLAKKNKEVIKTPPEEAKFAKTEKEVRAYRAPSAEVAPISVTAPPLKEVIDANGVDGTTLAQVQEGLKKLQAISAPAKCVDCEVMMAGKGIDQECEETKTKVGQLNIWQTMEEGKCQVAIWPEDEQKEKWPRRYFVKSNGQFETKDSGGARSFYFFPRKNEVRFQISEDQKVITLQTTSDVQIQVSTETGKIVKVQPVSQWKEYESMATDENPNEPIATGFLTISPSPGTLMLDLQMGNGEHPELSKKIPAILKNGDGKNCQIPKVNLFEYVKKDGILDSFDFKFKTDQEFEAFYKKQCKW